MSGRSLPYTTHPEYFRYTYSTLFGFQFNGFKREGPIRILLLLGAMDGMLNKDPNSEAGIRYRRAFNTKKGIMAQLVHYGVPFNRTDTQKVLRERLIHAARTGRCDKQPAELARIQEFLRKINEEQMAEFMNEREMERQKRPALRLEMVLIPNTIG